MRFILSLILKPLSIGYGLIVYIRHWLYDRGFLASYTFDTPIIKIGNLSFGGTGKSPMTIFLANYFKEKYEVNIVSRGYGRSTKGLQQVYQESKADDVGDEPLMIKRNCVNSNVFVCEDRVSIIQKITKQLNIIKIIILDDALQHRRLKSGFQILLTDYNALFFDDSLFPLGKLRDIKSRASLADAIIVTKSKSRDEVTISKIKKYSNAPIFFSQIEYLDYLDYFQNSKVKLNQKVILVSAIANISLFKIEIKRNAQVQNEFSYRDHYRFKIKDVNDWINDCHELQITQIVTTEKDAVKLLDFKDIFIQNQIQLVVLPIQVQMTEEDKNMLFTLIENYIQEFEN